MIAHATAVKQAATDAVVDLVDVDGPGDLQLLTSGDAVLLTHALEATAFGAADADGEAALAGVPIAASASADGTAAKFRLRDGNGSTIFAGTAGPSKAIAGVSTAARTFAVAADLSGVLSPGDQIRVSGSTGNDGWYTVVSAVYSDPNTTITVVEAVPDATGDGTLHPYDMTINNPALVSGQSVSITSYTYRGPSQ